MTFSGLIPRTLESWTDRALPFRCPLCGKGIPADGTPNMFCAGCMTELPFIRGKVCPRCGGERNGIFEYCSDCLERTEIPWRRAYALFRYEGNAMEAIRLFKFGGKMEMTRPLARLMRGVLPDKPEWECITYVPLHWMRYLQRGFNQSRLLAERIAAECGIPCRRVLKRVRNTPHQAFLDKKDRLKNLQGAFSFCGSTKPSGGCILLIDDVMTTGSTLAETSGVLLKAGYSAVDILVTARRQRS